MGNVFTILLGWGAGGGTDCCHRAVGFFVHFDGINNAFILCTPPFPRESRKEKKTLPS